MAAPTFGYDLHLCFPRFRVACENLHKALTINRQPAVARHFPFYRLCLTFCRVERMQQNLPHEQSSIPEHLRSLARLHPDYSRIELEESHAQLYRYFDLVWGIFVRLEQEGKLNEALTKQPDFPTVKTTKVEPQ